MLIITTAKAETHDRQPPFLAKFSILTDPRPRVAELRKLGYTHFLDIRPGAVTVGSISDEWRPETAAVFFKGAPTPFSELKAGRVTERLPVLEGRKKYVNMSDAGKSMASAVLDPHEIAAWLAFFESRSNGIRSITSLVG